VRSGTSETNAWSPVDRNTLAPPRDNRAVESEQEEESGMS
jgi:hypothetical protein